MANKKDDSLRWAIFRDFVPALKQQPAYLLIFGIAALFFFIAIGAASAAVIQGNAQLWWVSFLGLLASLIAAVIVIWRVQAPAEPPSRTTRSKTNEDQKTSENTAIRVLRDNGEMCDEIRELLKRSADTIKKVIVIQYSGRNVMDTLKVVLEQPGIEVEIYLVTPSRAVNDHQKEEVTKCARNFRNQLRQARNRNWQLFTYDAPGSTRAVLLKGQVLFTGGYLYEVVDTLDPTVLDIRGGEKPLLMVPSGNPGFDMLANELEKMVENWKHARDHNGNVTATPYESPLAQKV
jgi:hypothetical protein